MSIMEDNYVLIDVDSNGKEEVAKIYQSMPGSILALTLVHISQWLMVSLLSAKENSHPPSGNIINLLNLMSMIICLVSVRNVDKFTLRKVKMGLKT